MFKGDAVKRHPSAHPHARLRRSFSSISGSVNHPDTDAPVAPLAGNSKSGQRADDPFSKFRTKARTVGFRRRQVDHHIGDALSPGP